MKIKKEITLELTNYCPENCKYCSSESKSNMEEALFYELDDIKKVIYECKYERIILSGGEPLAHPNFYEILMMCKEQAQDVIVHTNAITHIMYNVNVIDTIYLEANLTVTDDINKIHVLKRINQGRERTRPEVKFSRNWMEDCDCDKVVYKPDGTVVKSPCRKFERVR